MTLKDFKQASNKQPFIDKARNIRANLYYMTRNGNLYSYLVGNQKIITTGRVVRFSINGAIVNKEYFRKRIKRL